MENTMIEQREKCILSCFKSLSKAQMKQPQRQRKENGDWKATYNIPHVPRYAQTDCGNTENANTQLFSKAAHVVAQKLLHTLDTLVIPQENSEIIQKTH